MIEILCSKSSITADTASESFTLQGCTNSNTHSINLGKTKSKPNEAFTTKQSQDSEIFQGATPWSTPATKLADSETDSRLVGPAVNDREPENSSLSIQRKRVTIPKQYSVLSIAQS